MKRFFILLSIVLLFCGCEKTIDPAGKSYRCEDEGFGGTFDIQIKKDGSFSYYEGMLSSYIGMGSWTMNDNILTLSDRDYNIVNYFSVNNNSLIFLAENSSNFTYVQLEDGIVFHVISEE